MKNSVVIVLFAVLGFNPCFAEVPKLAKEIQSQYEKSNGFQAEFIQNNTIQSLKKTKVSKGRIWVKRPNQFRWETLSPDASILLSDGKTVWFYTPPFSQEDRGQVMIRKSGQIQTEFLNQLLMGNFESKKFPAKIQEESKDSFWVLPFAGKAGDITKVCIQVDLTSALRQMKKITLHHASGNRTEVELSRIEFQDNLDPKLFVFEVNRKVEVLSE